MSHWSEKYVGRECGTHIGWDCADLCQLVQREVFQRDINLPSERMYKEKVVEGTLAKFRAMAQQIDEGKGDYARLTDSPIEGDGVLIFTRGYRQHIGIYCWVQNEAWVLHASDMRIGPQVVLQKVRDMIARGLRVEGYYKWI